jgi:drug/metabolite transporter (DMT)-like permease
MSWLVISGAFFAGDLICWHWSIAYTSVTNATFLANLAPLVVTLVAWSSPSCHDVTPSTLQRSWTRQMDATIRALRSRGTLLVSLV